MPLHWAEIQAALVTPTDAIPPWLHRKHPELMVHHARGQRPGLRPPEHGLHPPGLPPLSGSSARWPSATPHPAVIGWQVDNETRTRSSATRTSSLASSTTSRARSTVERLNEVWGLNYWSHRLHDWADLWTPDGNTNPGDDLAWRRFQDGLTADFLAWQVGIVKEYARPDQWVTQPGRRPWATDERPLRGRSGATCSPRTPTTRPRTDWRSPPPEVAAAGPGVDARGRAVGGLVPGGPGWSGRQTNFFVTETNALSVGGSAANFPAYDNQWRQVAYTFISRGANAITYWHWHTLHYGAETYWGGMLPHDYELNRCFRELSQLGQELRRHGDRLTDLEPEAEVGVALLPGEQSRARFQPPLTRPGQATSDPAPTSGSSMPATGPASTPAPRPPSSTRPQAGATAGASGAGALRGGRRPAGAPRRLRRGRRPSTADVPLRLRRRVRPGPLEAGAGPPATGGWRRLRRVLEPV